MIVTDSSEFLRRHGLRSTAPRHFVMDALALSGALSPADIAKRIRKKGHSAGIVTVYRVLAALESVSLVHRHPAEGLFSLCTLPDQAGHHILLHCTHCGKIDETQDSALCRHEDRAAESMGFRADQHLTELLGTCRSCSRS